MRLRVSCPKCGREEDLGDPERLAAKALESPARVAVVALDHGSHILLVMVDERGQVVGTEVSERASAGGVLDRIMIRPLPARNPPSLDALSRDEWRVFALCDGTRTTQEISSILGIPEGMVRLIVESLQGEGATCPT